MNKEDNNSNVISTGMELTNSGKRNTQIAEKGQDSVTFLTANSSESVQIIEGNISNDLKEKEVNIFAMMDKLLLPAVVNKVKNT